MSISLFVVTDTLREIGRYDGMTIAEARCQFEGVIARTENTIRYCGYNDKEHSYRYVLEENENNRVLLKTMANISTPCRAIPDQYILKDNSPVPTTGYTRVGWY